MRILLRGGQGQDLYGEYSTLADAFVAAGGEAQRSGSSRPDRLGAFAQPGLLVRDAGPGRRWLPRQHLTDYLGAPQAEDRERLLLLTRPPEAA